VFFESLARFQIAIVVAYISIVLQGNVLFGSHC